MTADKNRIANRRNTTIDLLKFIFAVIIVLFHGNKHLTGQGEYFINGRLGVEFFFIVSGYLMVASARRYTEDNGKSVWQNTGSFIGHKIARLSPDVFIAWIVAFIVQIGIFDQGRIVHRLLSGVFEIFFFTHAGFFGQTRVNGAVWYLSAMFIAMAILFPILVKKRNLFLYWLAPLLSLLLYGFLSMEYKGLTGSTNWTGFATNGVIRALAGLCLGAVCYMAAEKLRGLKLRLSGKILVSMIAFLSITYVIYHIYGHNSSRFVFVLVILLALGITLIFSGNGVNVLGHAPDSVNRFISFLGEFSMDLFLSHSYWSNKLGTLLPELSGTKLLLVYLGVVLVNAILLIIVSKLLRRAWPRIKKGLAKVFLQQE